MKKLTVFIIYLDSVCYFLLKGVQSDLQENDETQFSNQFKQHNLNITLPPPQKNTHPGLIKVTTRHKNI